MTIDFWACLIISQIYFTIVNREKKVMMAFASIAWFTLAGINLISNITPK